MTKNTPLEAGYELICIADHYDLKQGDRIIIESFCPGCNGIKAVGHMPHYDRTFFEIFNKELKACEQIPESKSSVDKNKVLKELNLMLLTLSLHSNNAHIRTDIMRDQILQCMRSMELYEDFIKTGGF